MIWSSPPAMIAIDLIIISMSVAIFVAFLRYGMFQKGYTPRTGRVLIVVGVVITGLFYLSDLLVMTLLPAFIDDFRPMEAMTFLHLEIQWITSLASVLLLGSGVIMMASTRYQVVNKMRRSILEQKMTRAALDDRRRFQEFVTAVSSPLITTAEENAGETLVDCLESVCRFFDTDRGNIIWSDVSKTKAESIYHWNEHGGPPWVEFSIVNFPWIGARLLAGEAVRINKIDDLPAEAAVDAASLMKLQVNSAVAVPLVIGNETLGALTFGTVSDEREWTGQDMLDLRVLADLFANIVVRINSHYAMDEVLDELRKAKERLEAENVYLREELSSSHGFDEIVGESPQLARCLHQVDQVAATTTAVLIQGETGTGKELIARAIHQRSHRRDRPLVKVNCAALPTNLIESELFGHEKGAFTGATSRKRGRFDLAEGGTLFLDEIGDIPLELQGKLLRVLQEGEFQRVGGTDTIAVDVRLIAATNRDLQSAVDHAEFRADLYYRINTFPIYLPQLQDREGDIPLLVAHFAKKHSALLGKEVTGMSSAMIEKLNHYSWPGNVRELEGVIQRSIISASGPILDLPESLRAGIRSSGSDVPLQRRADLQVAERTHIESVLNQARWVIGGDEGAAAKLGVPPSTLRSKMKKLGINRPATIG